MTLLEKSIELYLGIKAAKPMNDPMFLQIRDFIVTHFGHEGTRALAAADEQPVVFLYKQNPTGEGRRMRAFQHPLNANKRPEGFQPQTNVVLGDAGELDKLLAEYADTGERIKSAEYGDPAIANMVTKAYHLKIRINALTGVSPSPKPVAKSNVNKSDALAQKQAAEAQKTGNVGKPNSPETSQPKGADVAAGDVQPGGIGQPVEINVETAKTMKAKALGQLYPAETMRFWLGKMAVQLTGKESNTQLGALVLHTIKEKSL